MFVTCCFWLALVGIVNTQENDDLANLRKDQEILKKIVLELKKSNDNLHQKFMTMEEDLMEWKELVRQLKNENGYLKKEMTNMEQDLNDRMIKLENENIFLKSQCKIEALARNNRTLCGNEASPVVHQEKSNVDKKFKSNVKRQVIGNKERRLLLPSPTSSVAHVQKHAAFSACISGSFNAQTAGATHTFVYDSVLINEGNAYNNYTGIFTVPTTGVYAILWTVAVEGKKIHSSDADWQYGEIDTELVVNAARRATVHADTESSGDEDAATGFVILHLNSGDAVYIRSYGAQGVLQQSYHQWTFSGWQIM